ncbi:MFS transporter [methanogenic archaeon mixed culture ISO4-G1]|nr:MFS transporter [methanogenic archaeon mixed culture ISO4-G1]
MNMSRAELLALLAMAFGLLMDGLDASIVNIALPSIAEYFGTDTNEVAWVTISYFMMIAGMMLIFGRIADSGHIRKIYIAGFVIFAATSLVCGLSQNLMTLVAARCAQGVGAAMLAAVAPMICVKFIPARNLGVAMGVFMLAGSIGFGCGPAVGGIIVDLSSWHWCFFINVPIGVLGVLMALRGLPKDHDISKARLDLKGSLLIATCVISAVYILEMFTRDGQGLVCAVLGAVVFITLALFVYVEKRVDHPMLNVGMFRDWRLGASLMCYMLINVAYMGIYYILPFYMIKELELDYAFSGIVILIPSVVCALISLPAGRYCDLHGRRGTAIACAALMIVTSFGFMCLTPELGWWPLVPVGIMGGIVWGLCGPSVASRIIDLAPLEEKGMASTLSNLMYYAGGSIGTALFATLLTFGAGSIGIPIEDIASEAFMDGYVFTMVCAICIAAVAVVCAYAIKENRTPAEESGAF